MQLGRPPTTKDKTMTALLPKTPWTLLRSHLFRPLKETMPRNVRPGKVKKGTWKITKMALKGFFLDLFLDLT